MGEHTKRAVRVGDLVLREVADLLSKKVKDPRVNGVTLTGIHLSNDLRHAKIFFSHIGVDEDVRRAHAGLESAKGFIKREIGTRIEIRYVPEIHFVHDPSLKTGADMERLLAKLMSDPPVEPVDESE
ncbi:MAG: ribosome-binding factor A [Deltaproteobacteria bacterium HGW-Deltaproteobacteria-21]|nr:MAG: ribosome-binding factor A [Deltaproteobacteria bacterium HGW-Deltaproteobacteria-21]